MKIFLYLFYTLLLELPIVIAAYKKIWKTALLIDVLLNCFTWPLLNILYYHTTVPLLLLEACVCIIEAAGFKIFFGGSYIKALLVSLSANAASLFIGAWIGGVKIF